MYIQSKIGRLVSLRCGIKTAGFERNRPEIYTSACLETVFVIFSRFTLIGWSRYVLEATADDHSMLRPDRWQTIGGSVPTGGARNKTTPAAALTLCLNGFSFCVGAEPVLT